MNPDDRALLIRMFDAAIKAADPLASLTPHLPARPKGRVVVVGAGKGSAQMAAALETLWDGPLEGVVVTRYGFACPTEHIRILEAAHPVPDPAGLAASDALFAAVENLTREDLVIALISGGGSALLPAPAQGLTLEDEIALNRALLASGAPIGAMNAIRKQVSRIKGGRLARAAYPARVVSLIVSDVPGDDPAQVASGPTVADHSTRADALALVRDYGIDLPQNIATFLANAPEDAPSPDDPDLVQTTTVIASAGRSLEAAAEVARAEGITPAILSDSIEGEARDVALVHAAIARECLTKDRPFHRPVVLLSGGETTVTLRGKGKGGRNSEFLLALARALDGVQGFAALAADTDGIDGSEDNAGAFADGDTAAKMRAAGIDPAQALAINDAFSAFHAVDMLFTPGPTGTNVNDFRAILLR